MVPYSQRSRLLATFNGRAFTYVDGDQRGQLSPTIRQTDMMPSEETATRTLMMDYHARSSRQLGHIRGCCAQTWVPSDETPAGRMGPRRWSGRPRRSRRSARSPCCRRQFATQTWVPSDETPLGIVPTAMVWTTEPVEAFSSVTVPPRIVRHPDVGAVGRDADRARRTHGDGLDDRAGRGVQLGHRAAAMFATQTWVPPNPNQSPDRYLLPDDRDFFAVYRPVPGPVTVPLG